MPSEALEGRSCMVAVTWERNGCLTTAEDGRMAADADWSMAAAGNGMRGGLPGAQRAPSRGRSEPAVPACSCVRTDGTGDSGVRSPWACRAGRGCRRHGRTALEGRTEGSVVPPDPHAMVCPAGSGAAVKRVRPLSFRPAAARLAGPAWGRKRPRTPAARLAVADSAGLRVRADRPLFHGRVRPPVGTFSHEIDNL